MSKPSEFNPDVALAELARCYHHPDYFIQNYTQIYDSVVKDWIGFELWPFQLDALDTLHNNQKVIMLKARQLGLTWLVLAYILWASLFRPIANNLLFSLRETDAKELLGNNRLRGMYKRLPSWMQSGIKQDQATLLVLRNESQFRAFATGTGDGYTGTIAFIDEASLIPKLDNQLGRVKPTIDAGGQLFLLSRANKTDPHNAFHEVFRRAIVGDNDYIPLFFPWSAHPNRDEAWYARMKRDAVSLDELYEHYPSTWQEALSLGYVGKVFPNFDPQRVVSSLAEYHPDYPVTWGVDLGYRQPHIVMMQERPLGGISNRKCVFAEYAPSNVLELELMTGALSRFPPPATIYYDTESASFPAVVRKVELEQDWVRGLPEVVVKGLVTWSAHLVGANKRVFDGIRAVRRAIGNDAEQQELFIHPRCKLLIAQLETYHFGNSELEVGGERRPASGQEDHGVDALRYAFSPWHYVLD